MIHKSCLLACILFLSFFSPLRGSTQQLRWSTDTVAFEYEGCQPESAVRFWMINDGPGEAIIDKIYGDLTYWEKMEYPVPTVIAEHDSVRFILKPKVIPTPELYLSDLFPTPDAEGKTTHLLLSLKHYGPQLTLDSTEIRLGSVVTGQTVTHTVTATNTGTRDFTFHSFSISGYDVPNASITGIHLGEIIPVGASKTFSVNFWSDGRRSFNGVVSLSDQCYMSNTPITGVFVPSGAQWNNRYLATAISGCDTGSVHQLMVTNDSNIQRHVDSIRLGPNMSGWSIITTSTSFDVQPEQAVPIQFHREQFTTTPGFVVLYPHDGLPDTAWFNLTYQFQQLAFDTPDDTIVYELAPGETRNVAVFIKNRGLEPTELENLIIDNNAGWSLLPFDQGARLGWSQRSPVNLSFLGNSVPGDYPITMTASNTDCGQAVTQTVIARIVEQSSVDQEKHATTISVHPTVTASHITISSTGEVRYRLFDLLGREILKGNGFGLITLDVSMLPVASYILTVESNDELISRLVKLIE